MEWPRLATMVGASEPISMPMMEANSPSRLAGIMDSGATCVAVSQVPMPSTTDSSAPWVLARFQ